NRHKVKQERFRLDVRKNLFPLRTVRWWSQLPSEAVQAPSLEVFQTQLDKALSSLV
ncbi:hypothetical protein N308_09741, partial [Struthio camelus australis]